MPNTSSPGRNSAAPDADRLDHAGHVPAEPHRSRRAGRRSRGAIQSVGLTPAAWTRTSTSVGRAPGGRPPPPRARSGPPNPSCPIARIACLSVSSSVVRDPACRHGRSPVRVARSPTCARIWPCIDVVVLALDGVYPFELSIPVRIFGTAAGPTAAAVRGHHLHARRRTGRHRAPTSPSPCSTTPTAIDDRRHARHRRRSMRAGPATRTGCPTPVAAALRRLRPGARIVSICTGVLRARRRRSARRPAGDHALERRRALPAHCSPTCGRRPTCCSSTTATSSPSAGAAAGVDLCLHLVRRDHGSAVANRVARRCVVPPWREGGQAQYIDRPVPEPATATTPATRQWALGQSRPPDHPRRAGRPRADERTHVHPPLPRRGRHDPGPVAHPAAGRARPAPAGDHRPAGDRIAAEAGFGTAASLRQHLPARSACRRRPTGARSGPARPPEADDGTRTRYLQLGKLSLYPVSYVREGVAERSAARTTLWIAP